jgi:flagellar hook assembly protein FlgD
VDTLPPQSEFTDPPEGSTTVVSGLVTFSGGSQDATSGLAGVEISLDNGNPSTGSGQVWQALTTDASGAWSFPWDTTAVPNGTYTVLVRAVDAAGNQENTARVTVVVSNPPPLVMIPESWQISESVPVSIVPQAIPLGGARLTVSDPRGRWPAFVEEYTADNLPAEIQWNGRFGDGTVAPPGEYPVRLEAWDVFGNTGSDAGIVIIPAPPTPTPTPVPTTLPSRTPLPSSTPVITASPSPTATPTQTTTALSTQTVPATPSQPPATPKPLEPVATEEPVPTPRPALLWPVIGFVALLAALASASLSDARPRALRLLGKALDSFLGKPL